jgi:RNA polymerase sigma-70 factor, ECF subfamily
VNVWNEAAAAIGCSDAQSDFEGIFLAEYRGVARAIAAINRDPGRAEELAVEVFLKWSLNRSAQGEGAKGWLYRVAIRMALDDLRGQVRRRRYKSLLGLIGSPPTPDEILAAKQEQEKVRTVLASMTTRQAELLLLRSQGFDYNELAAALELNPASVGILLSRSQQAFRKEYVKQHGPQ